MGMASLLVPDSVANRMTSAVAQVLWFVARPPAFPQGLRSTVWPTAFH